MIEDRMFYNYIGTPEKAEWYDRTFKKYEDNLGGFEWNWSWWAFFGGPFFLMYRKCYLEAFLYFLAGLILGGFGLALSIVAGFLSPYLIYKRYKRAMQEINRRSCIEEEQLEMSKSVGGVNKWAIWIAVLFIMALPLFAGVIFTTFLFSI